MALDGWDNRDRTAGVILEHTNQQQRMTNQYFNNFFLMK
jgi:hypothetical protein